jgi:hypothetical protein
MRKKNLSVVLIVLVLTGCSAAGLQQAENKTRLAGTTSPLGFVIWAPVWVASTIANAGSGPTGAGKAAVEETVSTTAEEKRD